MIMDTQQFATVLLQIGMTAIVTGVLYGFHSLIAGFDQDGRDEMMRQRDSRLNSTREWVATLQAFSDRQQTTIPCCPVEVILDEEIVR
jgi:hypothetical protein